MEQYISTALQTNFKLFIFSIWYIIGFITILIYAAVSNKNNRRHVSYEEFIVITIILSLFGCFIPLSLLIFYLIKKLKEKKL